MWFGHCIWCWLSFLFRVKIFLISSLRCLVLFRLLLFVCVSGCSMVMRSTLPQLYNIVLRRWCEYIISLCIEIIHYLPINPSILYNQARIKFDMIHIILTNNPIIVELMSQGNVLIFIAPSELRFLSLLPFLLFILLSDSLIP